MIGIEYGHDSKYRYDGVSEWKCGSCSYREGRWCERELVDHEVERPFCTGEVHPHVISLDDEDGKTDVERT